jgi:hypothetical protein
VSKEKRNAANPRYLLMLDARLLMVDRITDGLTTHNDLVGSYSEAKECATTACVNVTEDFLIALTRDTATQGSIITERK